MFNFKLQNSKLLFQSKHALQIGCSEKKFKLLSLLLVLAGNLLAGKAVPFQADDAVVNDRRFIWYIDYFS
jgi:hypothetical protein